MIYIEMDETLTIKVVLPSEGRVTTFERTFEPCLMHPPGLADFTRLGSGDICLCFPTEVFV